MAMTKRDANRAALVKRLGSGQWRNLTPAEIAARAPVPDTEDGKPGKLLTAAQVRNFGLAPSEATSRTVTALAAMVAAEDHANRR